MTCIKPIALAAALMMVSPSGVWGEEQNHRPFILAASCAACHGTDGNSPGTIPALAGRDAAFVELALKGFKSGARVGTVMNRIARGYTDEEIALIAGYFAGRQ